MMSSKSFSNPMESVMSKQLFERFSRAFPIEVGHWFASLPNATRSTARSTNGAPMWIYREGSAPPERRVLLVAHMDTVFERPPSRALDWYGNIATFSPPYSQNGYATRRAEGMGADDRAGCSMLWSFRNSQHSLLVCNDEEIGCRGASLAASQLQNELAQHAYAIEIDRRGDQNYVFYDTHTPEFASFIAARLPTWELQRGSVSDIARICKGVGICGVNLAAGFLYEHTTDEMFFLDAWLRTRAAIQRLMRATSAPFQLPRPSVSVVGSGTRDRLGGVGRYVHPSKCDHPKEHRTKSATNSDFLYCHTCHSYNTENGRYPTGDAKPIDWDERTQREEEEIADWWEERQAANTAALVRIGDMEDPR